MSRDSLPDRSKMIEIEHDMGQSLVRSATMTAQLVTQGEREEAIKAVRNHIQAATLLLGTLERATVIWAYEDMMDRTIGDH